MKSEAIQIKKIDSAREASLSDSNKSFKIPRKKEASTSILCSNKGPHKRRIRTMVPRSTECFAKRQELLSKIICHIVSRNVWV